MKQIVCILLLIFVWPSELNGQAPFFRQHVFSHAKGELLPRKVLESNEGYLWMGTTNGLYRYDGQVFTAIEVADSVGIINITSLYEDVQQRLWVGTYSKGIFYLETGTVLQKWNPEEGTPSIPITGFGQTSDSIFWFSTYGEGLYYWSQDRMYNMNVDDGLSSNEIYSIEIYENDQVIAGTDAGINICAVRKNQKTIQHFSANDGLNDPIVKTILPGFNGNFWIGTFDGGLNFWDSQESKFKNLTPDWNFGEINHLELINASQIWIGTNGNGIFIYDLQSKKVVPLYVNEFQHSKVSDIHQDIEGNLWVLDNANGISSSNLQFSKLNHVKDDIQAILLDRKGNKWIGTPNGFFRLKISDEGGVQLVPYLTQLDINVISLYEDLLGNLWLGTFGQGLISFHPETGTFRVFKSEDGLQNENILSIDGNEKRMFLATLGGVVELDVEKEVFDAVDITFRNYNHENGLGTDFIYKVFVDTKGRTWFGTDGKGVSFLEDNQITNIDSASGMPLKAVYGITEDNMGNIWFSTAEQGVFQFDGSSFYHLHKDNGLRNLEISSLICASNGEIVIVHQEGMDLVDPQTKSIRYYDTELGDEKIDPVLNAVFLAKNGTVWIGGKNQLYAYHSATLKNQRHPRVIIEKVNVFFEPINFKVSNTFTYRQNNLVFDYMGLWYSDPQKLEYAYKLEGYDLNWIRSRDLQAHYSNLTDGKYTFYVKASNNGNFINAPVANYSFEITPPIWKKSWFLLLALVVMGLLIYFIIRRNNEVLKKRAISEKEKIESQLEVLKSQINPHFLFNSFNTLLSLIEDEPAAATVYVEKLSDFYRNLLQYRQKDIIPLREELDLLEDFTYLLKQRFGENIHFQIPEVNGQAWFIPPLTLQMLVENAIKHNVVSRKNPLFIELYVKDGSLHVQNNVQKKLTKTKSTHFGLQSIQSRYALLGSEDVKIEQTDACFKVILPIIKSSNAPTVIETNQL